MRRRGESTLVSSIVLIGFALVIGVAMLSYSISLIAYYRSQVDLSTTLQSEVVNTLVNVVSYDNTTSTLWLLFKRIDGSKQGFFIVVEASGVYLNCSSILVYNPSRDSNSILCDEQNDCLNSSAVTKVTPDKVYVYEEGSVVDFSTYAKLRGYTLPNSIEVCRVPNVCEVANYPGACSASTFTKLLVPSSAGKVRVFLVVLFNNRPYIVNIYEVPLK